MCYGSGKAAGGPQKPIECASEFLRRPWGPVYRMSARPKGRKFIRFNVPIPAEDPWDLSETGKMLLQVTMQTGIDRLEVRVTPIETIHRNNMQTGCPGPGDRSHCAAMDRWSTMNLKGYADEYGCASTATTGGVGGGRVPYPMPPCYSCKRLERGQSGAEMTMFLQK